ncbi:MAG: FtsQ-type POTRA domain-containing protein [Candidatus Eremiobacteraeota bacterium]|nr:FtsQ-type POTRA domain-containing protein [Candidatus Eremiobacteraeota bacterium]
MAALFGGAAYGGKTLASDPRFALDDVAVDGARRLPSADIIAAAALPHGRNVWLLDSGAASRAIERLPWVASATIARAWPNKVTIIVSERVPAARMALPGGAQALVDTGGRVLGYATGTSDQTLPLLMIAPLPADAGVPGAQLGGTTVGESLEAMQQLSALGVRMTEVRDEPVTGFSAFTHSGVWVVFGDLQDLARKVELYDAIVKRVVQPSAVDYIDVRSTAAPTVQYR